MTHNHSFVRECLGEAWTDLDERWLDERPELEETLALVEGLGQWLGAAGRELRKMAPGAVQGALTGFATGGPAGAAMGAAAGGLGSRLQGLPVAQLAAPVAGAVSAGPPAAKQLLATLLRPEVLQALGAMALGPVGAKAVEVAGSRVPVAAFATLLSELAARAAAQQHAQAAPKAVKPAYAAKVANPASSAARAEALLSLLARAEELDEESEPEDTWADAALLRDLIDIDRLENA